MKLYIYMIPFLTGLIHTAPNPPIIENSTVYNIINKYAKKNINVYKNCKDSANLGFEICNFEDNGESLIIETFIKKNNIIIDAGAHIGNWTKAALKTAEYQSLIYAFEPIPASYQSVMQLANQFNKNIFAFNLALGKCETKTEMYYFYQRGSDCSTLYNRPILHDVPVQKVDIAVTYLDKFAIDYGIKHINFLKIDTEGAEADVLEGAHNLIQSNHIDIIQFEYGGTYPDAGITLFEIYKYLTSSQYLIFRIIPNGLVYIHEWNPDLENFRYSNYLALKS